MGSFAGVNIDAQNLQQAVSLAEQKKLLAEQLREYQLSQSLLDYRNSLPTMVGDVKVAMPQLGSGVQLSSDVILEKNASFVLNQDYKYTKNTYCPPNARCVAPPQLIINSGTKVTGRLIRRNNNDSYMTPAGFIAPNTYSNFLEAKGVGIDGSINIPIEYLTRLGISNNLITDNNIIVTVISLVDKKTGKCNETGLIQTKEYNPCRVSAVKGQTYKGYISGGSFYSLDGQSFIPINEYKIIEENSGSGNNINNGNVIPVANDKSNVFENSAEIKSRNENKTKIIIIGAFILGYLLSRK
jgi:hypothetical protein